jgi:predicted DCC family thiol-disulfide oxidoreductase YuxK
MFEEVPEQPAGCSLSAGTGEESGSAASTVFFDGSCALCRAEIGYYRSRDRAAALRFVDVSRPDAATPDGVSPQRAMQRFHVRAADGRLISGAAAFVEVWSRLPNWRWAARVAALPGVLAVMELGYRSFLPVRPWISRMVGGLQRRRAANGGARRG